MHAALIFLFVAKITFPMEKLLIILQPYFVFAVRNPTCPKGMPLDTQIGDSNRYPRHQFGAHKYEPPTAQ
jgi:hypothetical protein